jgi:hypothetical protein
MSLPSMLPRGQADSLRAVPGKQRDYTTITDQNDQNDVRMSQKAGTREELNWQGAVAC